MYHEEPEKVVTTTQELWIDGHHLIEKTRKTIYQHYYLQKTLVLVKSRSIDDKSYQVEQQKYFFYDSQVETEMTEAEVKKFEEDWTNLWDPDSALIHSIPSWLLWAEIGRTVNVALPKRVETDMTEDEVKKFEEDWTNMWDPEITQNDSI